MNLLFEKLSQVVAANQQIKQEMAGNFLRISECQYPLTIEILSGNRIVGRMANMQAGDYVRDFEFDGFIITNGANQQKITVQICGGGVGSDRVLGEVSVIDGGRFRTAGDISKAGYVYSAVVAGNSPHNQLWNPPGSGVNIFVEQLDFVFEVGNSAAISFHNAALSTNKGNPASKKSGGSASVAELRAQHAVSLIPNGTILMSAVTSAPVIRPTEPIMITPGWGLVAFANTGSAIGVAFEFYEEPI